MNPYQPFVSEFVRLRREGRALPLGGFTGPERPEPAPDAPTVLIFAPHPDDECIIGGLPLRMMRQAGARVVNVAVTQGSNPVRQTERFDELKAACAYLGFDLVATTPGGLTGINRKARSGQPDSWSKSVRTIAELIQSHDPKTIFFPHDEDWNSTHLGTHDLVVEALNELGPEFSCVAVETEFWGQMDTPNLMAESSAADVADLVAGISFHAGEVRRNPYHLILPAWMQDNVRRGGELVGGQGKGPPDFVFATLYRVRRWAGGRLQSIYDGGRNLAADEPIPDWLY